MFKQVAAIGWMSLGIVGLVYSPATARAANTYTVSTVDAPNSTLTVASGIDIRGQIVGYYVNAAGTHGFLFQDGAFSSIDFPGTNGQPHMA
jgi:probable HAF family extracellular repeat protein